MSDESEERWARHKREESEPALLEVRRFKVDGKPACMAWYGSGGHGRLACHAIGTSHMGSKTFCMFTGDELWPAVAGGILEPHDKCPVWRDGA